MKTFTVIDREFDEESTFKTPTAEDAVKAWLKWYFEEGNAEASDMDGARLEVLDHETRETTTYVVSMKLDITKVE